MKFSYLKNSCLVVTLVLTSCFGNRHAISQRPIASADRGEAIASREIIEPPPPANVYSKQKELKIKPVQKGNTTGSLTSLDDPRSYALGINIPLTVGTFLNIKTVSNQTPAAAPTAADPNKPATPANAAQLEQDLLKTLPNLEPTPDGAKPNVVTAFKAEVLEILENGDALVAYHRRSVRGDQGNDVLVKGRIPQQALADRDNLTTANFADVYFRESSDGEITERYSPSWEDEYTLRMSGFDEARSKSAMAIEEHRRQLKETRDKLATQIKTFSTERQTVAKERADLAAKQKAEAQKMSELQNKVKEQENEIEAFKQKEAEREKAEEETKLAEEQNKDKGAEVKPAADAKPGTTAAGKPATGPAATKPPVKPAATTAKAAPAPATGAKK